MSRAEKRAYLEAIRNRYHKSSRAKKTQILDELCVVCRYNRKYAIRILQKRSAKRSAKAGRQPHCNVGRVLVPLKAICLACDQMCSKKLKIVLREWLPYYEQENGSLDDVTRGQLYAISPATIDRLLKPIRISHTQKGISGTKPGSLLKKSDSDKNRSLGCHPARIFRSRYGCALWQLTFRKLYLEPYLNRYFYSLDGMSCHME